MAGKEKTRPHPPLTSIVPTSALDEEGGNRGRSAGYLTRRQGAIFCCGCGVVAVALVGFIMLILALTAFKVKDPRLSIMGIHIHGLRDAVGSNLPSANATMTADVVIRNPNAASFRLESSTVSFSYRGDIVGVASVPGSLVSAGKTRRTNVTVPVATRRVATPENAAAGGPAGSVNLTSYTEIKGRVNLFGVFRRNLNVFLNCDMTLDLSLNNQEARNLICGANTV